MSVSISSCATTALTAPRMPACPPRRLYSVPASALPPSVAPLLPPLLLPVPLLLPLLVEPLLLPLLLAPESSPAGAVGELPLLLLEQAAAPEAVTAATLNPNIQFV
jgi:hypothetical protein